MKPSNDRLRKLSNISTNLYLSQIENHKLNELNSIFGNQLNKIY